MAVNEKNFRQISAELKGATLVAVSKMQAAGDISTLYNLGHRDFGENYVQELVSKQPLLPADIRWHFIGHLQTNKVKFIASFVHLIHSVDSFKLLKEINKQAKKLQRIVPVLLQVHIAREETKFGFDEAEIDNLLEHQSAALAGLQNIKVTGLMGMATMTFDEEEIRNEFQTLHTLFKKYAHHQKANFQLEILSMGMSGDWQMAIEEGSTMVRIGSLLFGQRPLKTSSG
jgi:pyridoxal phosphate enzyme (YggS family)